MTRLWRFAMAIIAPMAAPAFADDPNPVTKVPKGDPAMVAAFGKAAATFDHFLAVWRSPPPGGKGFSVKIGLVDAQAAPGYTLVAPGSGPRIGVEWFWTNELREEEGGYSARLSNDPEVVHNVRRGLRVRFTRADVGDWMYWRDGKIVGNATACPALAHASESERNEMREKYGIDCP